MKKDNKIPVSELFSNLLKITKKIKKDNHDFSEKDANELYKIAFKLEILYKNINRVILILLSFITLLIGFVLWQAYYIDKIENINSELRLINNDLEFERMDSIAKKILNLKINDSLNKRTYSYYLKGGKIITYEDLSIYNDTLISENTELQKQNKLLEMKINAIAEAYDIKIHENISHEGDIEIKWNSKVIDSAYMLLNAFREKLYYDEDKKEWFLKK
ncbi:hypothetical protein QVZ41_13705 [Wenyingzhuangia sp. chi5]|uniref:Uncharacterized protein n=1 Tax=Wenyingzhuangia gilva TaxID=3057677 RepID=A0ABT8VVA1_9FLAO|nr:hypothetical protein [Wenyingzhuangia sp. chi5]MDO3695901.1 hypothetical protein [Wenyingzhuangia sp. chi5]